MNTRVLFVDDDPSFSRLTAMQLSKKLPQCELVFCESASEAFAVLDRQPAQIIFSDMRMPEMDGETFLSRVAEAHPATIRFAWSGDVTANQLGRFYRVAHQILNKPTPRETLVDLIGSLVKFRDRINNPSLLAFLGKTKIDRFACVTEGDVSVNQIALAIRQCPIAHARLLGIANSSFHSPIALVVDAERAVTMLGISLVRELFQTAEVESPGNGTLIHCEGDPDVVAAMLRSLGQWQFASFDRDGHAMLQAETGEDDSLLMEREQQRYGANRFDVASYVMTLWGINPTVRQDL